MLKIDAAAKTDIGRVRQENQDSYGMDSELHLYVVGDGMGGAAGGSVASDLAVRTFLAIARQEIEAAYNQGNSESAEVTRESLRRAVAAANRAVIERARWDTCYRGMGSTLVGARLTGTQMILINVGDSRAYLVRDGETVQLTDDHSFVAESVRRGMMTVAEAGVSAMRSVITRAIGVDSDVQPDLYETSVQVGDTVLLVSDGLTRHLSPGDLREVLDSVGDAEEACARLIEHANERGGSDNITCIVVRVGSGD